MKASRRIATLLLLAAIALLVSAVVVAVRHQQLVSEGTRVTAVVSGVDRSTDSEGSTTYAPIYSYEHGGAQYSHKPGTSTSSMPSVGSTETLYLDPSDPSHAMADTFADRWFGVVMLGAFGVAALVANIVVFKITSSVKRSRGRRDVLRPTTLAPPHHAPSTDASSASSNAASAGNAGPFITGSERPDPRGPFV